MREAIRLWLLAWLAAGLWASEQHGVVKFSGLPLPGATVTATQGDKKFVAVTDAEGVYEFRNLADGNWNFVIEMQCFETAKQEVAVAPNAPGAVWDLKLLPAAELAKIEAAPAPEPNRSPTVAAPTQTNVAQTPAGAPAQPPAAPSRRGKKNADAAQPANPAGGFQRAAVNAAGDGAKPAEPEGGAQEMNAEASDGLLINGSVNNGASSSFAQSAAFGNFRRAGRSLYNGNLGITFDNSNLDARSFSITGQDTPKPAYDRFTGLFSLGGPIPFTHRMQSRPMFVLNYQWTRNRTASIADGLMPTLAERAGEVAANDPLTGDPFPGGVIPTSRISPQAQALMALYPLPNFSSALYNYQVPLVTISHQDAMQTRLNKTVGRMNQLNGMFAFQDIRGANPSIFNFQDTSRQFGMMSNVNWLHRFNQHAFLTLGAQYSRMDLRSTPFFANRENVSGAAGISGNLQDAANWGPPALSFASGTQGLTDGNESLTRNQTAGGSADLFWSRSPHNIHVGLDARRQEFNPVGQQNPRGSFAFTGAATGSDFADFLLGLPDTVGLAYGNADKYFRSAMWDAYFTDDWRMSPGFTLNAGMRWEYGAPITELYGRLVNLDVTQGFTSVAPVVAANPAGPLSGTHYPASLINPDKRGFEPRIGFAWHPFLASSLVVRGGYGIYYDTSVYQSIAMEMAQQAPLSRSLSMQGAGLTMATAFEAPPTNTPDTFGIDPHFRPGYSQNWQLSVQRDLPGSLVMTATYLGIKGTDARQLFLPNTYPTGAANPCPLCPTGFTYETSGGNSTRQAGTLQIRRRLRAGLGASLNYTYSKSIDDAATGGRLAGAAGGAAVTGPLPTVTAQNWLDLGAERGLSSFDQRHLLTLQAQYSTGQGIGGGALLSGWKGAVLKEWTFVTSISAGSGLPLTPIYFAAVAGTGSTGTIRPDYTGAPLYNAPAGRFLNPAAFSAPLAGEWGNAGRDTVAGPAQFSLNGSLGRTFQLGDRRSLDLRFDATNALNHVTYPSWNTTVTSSQFGLPASANAMRSVQTTLRVRF